MKTMAAVASSADDGAALRLVPPAAPAPLRSRRRAAAADSRQPSDLEPSIYRFIIKHSWKQQIIAAGADARLVSVSLLSRSTCQRRSSTTRSRGDAKFPQYVLRLRVRAGAVSDAAVRRVSGARADQRRASNTASTPIKGQLGERMLRRFRYQLYHAAAALSADLFPQDLVGPDHPDGHGRMRVARRLYRRRAGPARCFRAARC